MTITSLQCFQMMNRRKLIKTLIQFGIIKRKIIFLNTFNPSNFGLVFIASMYFAGKGPKHF